MNRSILFIPIVLLSLIWSLVQLHTVYAMQSIPITLSILNGGFICNDYPISVDMGSTLVSPTDTLLTGDTWSGTLVCDDLNGNWSSQMLVQSTQLTGSLAGVIPTANISWIPTGVITTLSGDCSGLSLGTGGTLDAPRTLIKKIGIKTCSFTYSPDGISILVPGYSPVSTYTATITITNPT